MSDVAIRVEGLGKMYRIGAETERTDTFRDAIVGAAKGVARNIGLLAQGQLSTGGPTEEFWALRDVDFEIKRGEAVGIIGRNGAGKSTLLKILSRITEPTTGRITMNGRVASLLEVGTGFHPELTGRENIYLNGAIIGMTRAEIRRKFDEIVDFAGVEKFLDTPVKRYSSGMGVRLGFAVAAHLEPEILIVDEVLAVGDAEFQKKCLGKMNEVAGEGRTVLFVSHNMAAVQALCSQGMYLIKGAVDRIGPTTDTIATYLGDGAANEGFSKEKGTRTIALTRAQVRSGAEVCVDMTIQSDEPAKIAVEVTLTDSVSTVVGFCALGYFNASEALQLSPGDNHLRLHFPSDNLASGRYGLSIDLTRPFVDYVDRNTECLGFNLSPPVRTDEDRIFDQGMSHGATRLPSRFEVMAAGNVPSRYSSNGKALEGQEAAE